MTDWTLQTRNIRATISSLGAMMAPVEVTLLDGRRVQPFKLTGWAERAEAQAFPPVMRALKGDFACVPYGAPQPPTSLRPDWAALFTPDPAFTEPHGPGANHDWGLVAREDDALALAIDYPAGHPVRRVEKQVRLHDADRRVEVALTVHAREVRRIACGVHPVFEIGDVPGGTHLEAAFAFGRTFPGDYVPGAERFAPDVRFDRLDAVPARGGGMADASRLPWTQPADDVLQLCGVDGALVLRRPQAGYAVEIGWDARAWPSCLLWIASGGRKEAPFDGAFRALAVEPVAAAFGIGSPISADPNNPIARDGVRTWIDLDPATPWLTRYRFRVRPEPHEEP